jgi:AP-1 complex subunit beta-1
MQDIFRCYPNRYEAVIAPLCEALDVLEEPDAKAAMIWIVGEYAERIDNAEDMLALLLDTFLDEPVAVQLQLLTATVKLFLKKPGAPGVQKMISSVLTAATQQTDNPDLRDRAYMYWRLLSAMPEVRRLVSCFATLQLCIDRSISIGGASAWNASM